MLSSVKSVSLTQKEIEYIQEKSKMQRMSFSAAVGFIVKQHQTLNLDIQEKQARDELRNAATKLWAEFKIPQEEIIALVRYVTGGFEK